MTSIRCSAFVLLVVACSSRSSPPPSAVGPSAPPVMSWDPAALPRTVAVTGDGGALTLARLTATSLEVVGSVASPGAVHGWLDAHTLVGLAARDGGGFVVTPLVDGQPREAQLVTRDEWPAFAAELVLGADELWLSGCKAEIEYTDCKQPTAIRLLPGPRVVRDAPPSGRRRYGYHGDHLLPAPTGAAPAGVSARLDEVRENVGIDPEKTVVTCTTPEGETRVSIAELFATPLELEVYGFASPRVRWLATEPPLLEVTYDYTDPVEITRQARHVLRSCGHPLDDFRWLGDGVWAQLDRVEDEPAASVWTVRRGAQVLGTLRGSALD